MIAPGARMASTALARCTSCKNSRWQRATGDGWQFPVAKCSFCDCERQMPSDTFREDSQRKRRLRTNAHGWSPTATRPRTFSSDEWQKLECCDDTRGNRLSESSDKTQNMSRSSEEEPHRALITFNTNLNENNGALQFSDCILSHIPESLINMNNLCHLNHIALIFSSG